MNTSVPFIVHGSTPPITGFGTPSNTSVIDAVTISSIYVAVLESVHTGNSTITFQITDAAQVSASQTFQATVVGK